ncbi:hypothetical protein RQP46_009327 [Phenoliferia psychrophenolica]
MLVNGAPVGAVAILLALFSSVGGFIFGYDTGQISDFLEMDDFLTRFASCTDRSDASTCHFTNVRTGLIVSMLSIGTMVGALTGATIADRMGRRRAITIYCLWVCLGTVIQAASIHSWEQLMSLVATYQLFITFGILIAYCISIGTRDIGGSSKSGSWRIVLCLNILWALILGIGILFAPESPRWLMAKGLEVECELALARIRGVRVEDNDLYVKQTLVEIEAAVRAEEQMDKFRWIECFYPGEKILYRCGFTLIRSKCAATDKEGVQDAAADGAAEFPAADGIMIVSACLFIAGYAMTWAPFITGDIHYRYGFIFAACNLAGAVIVYLFLYESSALSLEMVDMMYNDPKVKPWNSAKWVPPGHQSRADFNQAIEAERKQNLLKDVKHRELADGPEDSAAAQHPTAIQEKHAAAAADA